MKVATRILPLFAAVSALPLLAACESMGGGEAASASSVQAQSCPEVLFVREARVLVQFDGSGTAERNMISKSGMTGYVGECSYGDTEVEVSLDARLKVKRGEAARGDELRVPYFVAIMAPDRQTILARRSFVAEVEFEDEDGDEVTHTEELVQRIPIRSIADGEQHQIIMGFELTEAQQAYNERAIAESRAARP